MKRPRTTKGIYVESRRGRLEMCKFDCRDFYFFCSSVNGLVLANPANKEDHSVLYIVNPFTKQREPLPWESGVVLRTTLSFTEASMKYKVVSSHCPNSLPKISVLTIGVDNVWRYLEMQHMSSLFEGPFATRVYVHWISESSVVTMNVETEIIYEFARHVHQFGSMLLAMGRNLSSCHLFQLPESSEYLMEVTEMNPENVEWTKFLSSDLKPLSDRFKGLKSVNLFGVLAGGEVFLFGISGSEKLCAAYNVWAREIQSFQLGMKVLNCYPRAHVNTVIWYE